MHRDTLDCFPAFPPGKVGWPWTDVPLARSTVVDDKIVWPRVTVVTPSYNQGQFIEETIRSVILQGYPNLEYILIDGGSTDNTLDIIKKYQAWISYWTSEKDAGQTNALNKGFHLATGDIIAWLNSDDVYYPHAVLRAASYMLAHPDKGVVHSNVQLIDANSNDLSIIKTRDFDFYTLLSINGVLQPTVFMRHRIIQEIGPLDEDLQYAFDLDYWIRLALHYSLDYFYYAGGCLAKFRLHDKSKTVSQQSKFLDEHLKIYDKVLNYYSLEAKSRKLVQKAKAQILVNQGHLFRRADNYGAMQQAWKNALRTYPTAGIEMFKFEHLYPFILSFAPDSIRQPIRAVLRSIKRKIFIR